MPFRRMMERRRRESVAASLYVALVEQARKPVFYTTHGVPDTLEGRYDMIVVHAWLLLRRLSALATEDAKALSQTVFDYMFTDMDRNLREMGVSDLRVGKRVQRMAEAFYGRAAAYDRGVDEGKESLRAALTRNLYQVGEVPAAQLDGIVAYVLAQVRHMDALDQETLLQGRLSFAEISP